MRNPMAFRGAREGLEARKRVSDIDLHALSNRYGRVFAGCTLVVPGANRTYRLNAGDNAYYLRLYRPFGRSKAEIAFEMCLLHKFDQCRASTWRDPS
jgi:Ser/Thr protein kinase RdoA (MazF antagonist)